MLENEGATPEVPNEVEQAEPVEKSMDDTIRETLRGLREKGVEPEAEAKPVESDEEKAQRLRDEQGRFKAAEQAPEVAPEVPETPASPAPNTWRKEVAEKWATLPPEVQAEVARREADFHKGIEGYRAKAQFADSIERVLQPHMQTLQGLGVSPDVAIGELLSADHKLRYGTPQEKQMYFQHLAQSYGVDLKELPEMQPMDPNVHALQQEIVQLKGWIQNQTQQGQQKEMQELNSTLASFAADPKHSHFESVRGHMAALLQAGQATTLEDAYEQAVYANPTTRAAMLQQQLQAARDEAAKKAQAARETASINVPRRPSMPVSQPIGTMDETIRATLRRLQNA